MPHVDDGTLHAYLDGALSDEEPTRDEVETHLRACGDCRVRLDAALTDREGAGEILGLLAPNEILTPPFEEMLARREARGGPVRGRGGSGAAVWSARPAHLAWAASILVALGGGWMARGVMLQWPDADPAGPAGVAEAPAPGAQGGDQAADPEEGAPGRVSSEPEAAFPGAEPQVAEAARPDAADREPEPGREPVAPPPVVADAATAGMDTVASGLAPMIVTGARGLRQAPLQTAAARGVEIPEPAPRSEGVEAEAPAPLEEDQDAVYALAAADLFAAEAEATAREGWTPVSPAEAAGLLGHPPLEMDGVPWERMEAAEVMGHSLVRTWHPLAGERWAVLVQVRQDLLHSQAVGFAAFQRRMTGDLRTRDEILAPDPGTTTPARWVRDGLVGAVRGWAEAGELEVLLQRLR
jgi:hypothetical protein